ncbi:MAG TPA: SDR family NAD(P)-dependent oxidoreductase [Ktedonobacteraceae bacterium]
MSTQKDQASSQQRVLQTFADMRARLDAYEHARTEPIAIIGAACRFPGHTDTLEKFWQMLYEGRDAMIEVPAARWNHQSLYDPDPNAEGKISTRRGAFLAGDPGAFDAQFFEITPREAASMDPQQRLFLEVSWEAFENAGQTAEWLQGKPIGIFASSFNNDYLRLQVAEQTPPDAYGLLGTMPSALAGRLAYLLGTQGPTLHVDTACSSSLVALHLACQSLRQGECNLALVGSVSLMLTPEPSVYLSRMGVLAPDGLCKTFDARADGFARGEGCGALVLKRLSAAQADHDPILALIRGTAVNHDGRSNGLTAPNSFAQQELLRQALRNAGVRAAQIQYVEAHGTGTALGDPIELQALGRVMGEGHEAEPLLVGSVKTNLGHLEPVAGIAGLFKVILALQHETIPPHLHLQIPNAYIPWNELSLRVPTTHVPWPGGAHPRLAGVSSFGMTGTNAHVIIEEAPLQQANVHAAGGLSPREEQQNRYHLLPLSARSPVALRDLLQSYQTFLAHETRDPLADICYTASLRRDHHASRCVIVGASCAELQQQLAALLASADVAPATACESPGLVFVFPGHGSQWTGMGRQLFAQEPVFRAAIERCDQAIRTYVSWSLITELHSDVPQTQLVIIQLLIFAVQVALVDLWRSWGIQPAAVVGHSIGEITGFHVAGVLTLDDAVRIIYQRGTLLQQISGMGSLALVGLPEAETRDLLTGYETRLCIAGSNSERATLISGDVRALGELLEQLSTRGIFCSRVKIDFASHSPQVDKISADLTQTLATIQPQDTSIALYSTVSGRLLQGYEANASYWVRNLRQPVLFARATRLLREHGYRHFLEISAHPVLLPAIEEDFRLSQQSCLTLASLRRGKDERYMLLNSLGALYTAGYLPTWAELYHEPGTCVMLPNYPWQRTHFWLEKGEGPAPVQRKTTSTSFALSEHVLHPLLGVHTTPALHPTTHYWEQKLSIALLPFLADHVIRNIVVFPGAAYIEMVLSAARELFGAKPCVLSEIHFEQFLLLEQQEPRRVQLVFTPLQAGRVAFCILSGPLADPTIQQVQLNEAKEGEYVPDWTRHASGIVSSLAPGSSVATKPADGFMTIPGAFKAVLLANVQERCTEELVREQFYASAERLGLRYGSSFQAIEHVWIGAEEGLARVRLPSQVRQDATSPYLIHPILLDACLQAILPLLMQTNSIEGTYLPTGIERCSVFASAELVHQGQMELPFWSYVKLRTTDKQAAASQPEPQTLAGDIFLLNAQGEVLMALEGVHFTLLETATPVRQQDTDAHWRYVLHWQIRHPEPPDQMASTEGDVGNWLLLTEQESIGQRLQRVMEARGARCISVTPGQDFIQQTDQHYQMRATYLADWRRLFQAIAQQNRQGRPLQGIVFMWGLERDSGADSTGNTIHAWQQYVCGAVLYLIQALGQLDWRDLPRLYLLTRAVQKIDGQPSAAVEFMQSTLWGLGRTIAYEQPRLQCTLVDISLDPVQAETALLGEELISNNVEDQLALRGEQRYVARLAHHRFSLEQASQGTEWEEPLIDAGDLPLYLETTQPGVLEHLRLRATTRRSPSANEIEVEVDVVGLNFLDVLKAMGVYPGQEEGIPRLGVECVGRVARIGEHVQGFQPGDEVIAIATETFRSFVITPASLVFPKPPNLSAEEAAAVPMVFLTAYYALVHLGCLGRGERVLIHSAAGGTGLAAVQIAQRQGAEIFATAGTAEKRAYLQELGIKHVLDSRSLAFAHDIREASGGEGVDLVLNSLTGEAAEQSLALLRPFGRFLEISKKDIYAQGHLPLAYFRKNLSYQTIDIAGMLQQRPELVSSLLTQLLSLFTLGQLRPLPVKMYALENIHEAFSTLAQGKHIGKIVVSFRREQGLKALPEVRRREEQQATPLLRAESTYLLSGGLGALGLSVATWLAEQGARFLMLVGRSAPSAEAEAVLARLQQQGVKVEVALADVSRREELAAVLSHVRQKLPPLRGVLHLAARLHDGILSHLTPESFQDVLEPKVLGAWHLHTLTREEPLDFFVLFSSVASLLGSPGQGNYAAANAFLDGLACYRRQQGLPALSINWGPWARIGLASSQENRGQRLAGQGLISMLPEQALAQLEYLLRQSRPTLPPCLGIMSFNLRQWRQATAYAAHSMLFEQLPTDQADGNLRTRHYELRDRLEAVRSEDRLVVLESALREFIKRILRLPSVQIGEHITFKAQGFDSLMAIELRNLLENTTGLTLPATLLWQYPTIAALSEHLAEKMHLPLTHHVADTQQNTPQSSKDEDEIRQSSPDEIAELLDKELDDLNAFLN